jgi:peptidoglycan/LPS O-acetylase OafA/YrhL
LLLGFSGSDQGDRLLRTHANNFGLLRLTFALLVIITHSFQLLDGNSSRDPLVRVFRTLTLGDLGVDAFFMISGYLVVQSFQNSGSIFSYLQKRALRIYPAFCVSFVICACVIAPLMIPNLMPLRGNFLLRLPAHVVALDSWGIPMTGEGLPDPYDHLNGSMWTVAYEFRCYLLVVFCGLLAGPMRLQRSWIVVLTLALLIAMSFPIWMPFSRYVDLFFGEPSSAIRFTAMFCSGASFYLFRDRITFRTSYAALAALALPVLLFSRFAEQAVALCGAYLIFWFAFRNTPRLHRINNETDISYGTYLYGWPIQKVIIWSHLSADPYVVLLFSSITAMLVGFVSWRLVEEPCLRLKFTRRMSIPASVS